MMEGKVIIQGKARWEEFPEPYPSQLTEQDIRNIESELKAEKLVKSKQKQKRKQQRAARKKNRRR